MPSHSVGHHPKAGTWLKQIAVLIVLAHTAFVAHAETLKGKGDIAQLATKRFLGVLCGALPGTRSRHFATGSAIRVSKLRSGRPRLIQGVTALKSSKPISKCLRTAESGKCGKQ